MKKLNEREEHKLILKTLTDILLDTIEEYNALDKKRNWEYAGELKDRIVRIADIRYKYFTMQETKVLNIHSDQLRLLIPISDNEA